MPSDFVQVRCPACRQVHAVPAEKVGTAFTCPGCRAAYVIPRPVAAVAPPPIASAPSPPRVSLPKSLADPTPERITIDPQRGRRFGQVLAGVLLGAIGLIILAVVAVPVWYFRRQPQMPVVATPNRLEETSPFAESENNPTGATAEATEPTLPSASTAMSGAKLALDAPPRGVVWISAEEPLGISRSGARVRVVRAEYGAVMGRDERNQPIPLDPADYLKIYVSIENRTTDDMNYVSWYGNHFSAGGKRVMARLWDDSGKPYPQHPFDQQRGIQGYVPLATIEKMGRQNDVIIFSVPAAIIKKSAHTLRLELPGGALNNPHVFRFEIPRSMLSDF